MSTPKCRIVVKEGLRGVKTLELYDPQSGRTAPAGQSDERGIQKRVEQLQHQVREGGSDCDVINR